MTDYLERNRAGWTKANEEYTDARASEAWAADEITWGMFGPSDEELGVLGDVSGKDVIELGCGTAYFGAWLAKRGARVTGVDITPAQLETARRMSEETGIATGADRGERGGRAASRRVIRPRALGIRRVDLVRPVQVDPGGGAAAPSGRRARLPLQLGALHALLSGRRGKVSDRLVRPQFGMHRLEWTDDDGVEFHLGHGDMLRLLRETGFEVEGLWEVQASESAKDHSYYDFISAEWARKWPAEEIWKARKRG